MIFEPNWPYRLSNSNQSIFLWNNMTSSATCQRWLDISGTGPGGQDQEVKPSSSQQVRTRRSGPAATRWSWPAVQDQQQPLGPDRLVLRFSLLLFGLKEKKTFPPLEWQGHSPNSPRLRIPGCCSNDRTKRELWHDAERLNVLRMCRKARPHRTMVNAPSWRRSPHNDRKEETITVSTVFYL